MAVTIIAVTTVYISLFLRAKTEVTIKMLNSKISWQ